MEDFLVTSEHYHALRTSTTRTYCVPGARLWCAANKIDFDKFLTEGLMASEFEATGDAIALELVQVAREVEARGKK
jgi:hypothetical protein